MTSLTEAPWRDGWDPLDPLRPCYTCGEPPTHFFDRSRSEPAYSCGGHTPFILGEDSPPFGGWSARATRDEWELAFKRARQIIKENEERGWKTKYIPRGKTELEMKARGVVAEIVAARLTGLEWDQTLLRKGYKRRRKRADIGSNVEVRNTQHHDGDLALYDNDPDHRIALLVTGTDPFTLRGWGIVRKIRKAKYFRTGEPNRWVVPQSELNPMPLPPDA